jgi:hypothetical protein
MKLKGINNVVSIKNYNKIKLIEKKYDIVNNEKFNRELYFYILNNKKNFIPNLISFNCEKRILYTKYIEGEVINDFNESILKKFYSIIDNLISDNITTNVFPAATESVFSYLMLKKIVWERIISCYKWSIIGDENINIINDSLIWCYSSFKKYETKSVSGNLFERKILSPSDMGIHNSLLTKDGLIIFDFEHAGIDSILNLIFNLVYHRKHINYSNKYKRIDYIKIGIQKLLLVKSYDSYELEIIAKMYQILQIVRICHSLSDDIICKRIDNKIISNKKEFDGYININLKNLTIYHNEFRDILN